MAAALLSNEKRDWMWLPDIILASISSYLVSSHDYVRFSCVCKQWHSVAKYHKQSHMATAHEQVPFLLVPPKGYYKVRDQLWTAYGVTQGQPREFKLTIPYHHETFRGSSHGWLAFLETDFRRVTLFNPFTNGRISLPALTEWSTYVQFSNRGQLLVKNVILSANPCIYGDDDYTVAAIIEFDMYYTLALIRPGRDKKWTHLNVGRYLTGKMIFDRNGKWIYATTTEDKLVRANIKLPTESTEWETSVLPRDHDKLSLFTKFWLVEASRSGEPLMVSATLSADGQTRRKAFELRGSSVVEVDDLNGDAILVGETVRVQSRLWSRVAARDFQGIEPNCVYVFHHDVKQGKEDDLSNATVRVKDSPCGIWISPTINL